MFHVLQKSKRWPKPSPGEVYLKIDHWNDYSFVTAFDVAVCDEEGHLKEIGPTKIGFYGQNINTQTYSVLPDEFDGLDESFFSLGQSVEFYKAVGQLSGKLKSYLLNGLVDIVNRPNLIDKLRNEKVFSTSLLRHISLSVIKGQFARVLVGLPERTDFHFSFERAEQGDIAGINLPFRVIALSTPSTNVHCIIGRNGVGKTTILNGMVDAIRNGNSKTGFMDLRESSKANIRKDYFSSVVSVSFSAFDSFEPPREQSNPAEGTCYFYIGLKSPHDGEGNRDLIVLRHDCALYLMICFSALDRSERWQRAIDRLGSDVNFAAMNLGWLRSTYESMKSVDQAEPSPAEYFPAIMKYLSSMSAGHAIVLLAITYLVARVEEKTLVIFDEPESHLHPPLLSAFIRSLADLLHDRNGVAIVATHSPVVLQEIPRSCVWKVNRSGSTIVRSRPDIETFGENVGLLTSEVFGLEVERSGFHALLAADVEAGKSYDDVIEGYGGQLGLEGKAILRALLADRERR